MTSPTSKLSTSAATQRSAAYQSPSRRRPKWLLPSDFRDELALPAPLHRQPRLLHAHGNGSGWRAEQAPDGVDQGVEDLADAIGKLFRLFSHLSFIMGAAVMLSTPIPILQSNSRILEPTCTFI